MVCWMDVYATGLTPLARRVHAVQMETLPPFEVRMGKRYRAVCGHAVDGIDLSEQRFDLTDEAQTCQLCVKALRLATRLGKNTNTSAGWSAAVQSLEGRMEQTLGLLDLGQAQGFSAQNNVEIFRQGGLSAESVIEIKGQRYRLTLAPLD